MVDSFYMKSITICEITRQNDGQYISIQRDWRQEGVILNSILVLMPYSWTSSSFLTYIFVLIKEKLRTLVIFFRCGGVNEPNPAPCSKSSLSSVCGAFTH